MGNCSIDDPGTWPGGGCDFTDRASDSAQSPSVRGGTGKDNSRNNRCNTVSRRVEDEDGHSYENRLSKEQQSIDGSGTDNHVATHCVLVVHIDVQ